MRGVIIAGLLLARPANANDGVSNIIGGTASQVGDHPSVVAVTFTGAASETLCTGVLIDPEWVVTAAHCVQPGPLGLTNQTAVTQAIRVNLGTIDVDADPGTVLEASDTIPRSGFNFNNARRDIGLIRLATPVTTVTPSAVNLDAVNAPVGITVLMVGYGATDFGGGGEIGEEFALAGQTSVACPPFSTTAGLPLLDEELLCFDQSTVGKCNGDSGGPSFAVIGGVETVVGLSSIAGQQCMTFGADTRTDAERNFLVTNIPQLDPCVTDGDCKADLICSSGGCVTPPPGATGTGDLGDACTAPADCISDQCVAGPDGMRCTKSCVLDDPATCPTDFECLDTADGAVCWPVEGEDGGCCDSGGRDPSRWVWGVGVLAVLLRRRRLPAPT